MLGVAQLLKGKDNGAQALSAWLKLLLKSAMGNRGMGQATSTPTWNGRVLCWAQVLPIQGSPGQLHLASLSSGSEDSIHSGTPDQWFQGGWEDSGMMLWGLVWLE